MFFAGAMLSWGLAAASARAPGASVTLSVSCAGALPDHGEPDAAFALGYRKLQGLARLQRHFRQHIDHDIRDRYPHQIFGQQLQHPGVDHRSRLQRQVARSTLDGNDGKDRVDGNRHRAVSLDCKR